MDFLDVHVLKAKEQKVPCVQDAKFPLNKWSYGGKALGEQFYITGPFSSVQTQHNLQASSGPGALKQFRVLQKQSHLKTGVRVPMTAISVFPAWGHHPCWHPSKAMTWPSLCVGQFRLARASGGLQANTLPKAGPALGSEQATEGLVQSCLWNPPRMEMAQPLRTTRSTAHGGKFSLYTPSEPLLFPSLLIAPCLPTM